MVKGPTPPKPSPPPANPTKYPPMPPCKDGMKGPTKGGGKM